MSRYFKVPVTIFISVKVPDTGEAEADRSEASGLATTLVEKRVRQCEWGTGQSWSAKVSAGFEVGYPTALLAGFPDLTDRELGELMDDREDDDE